MKRWHVSPDRVVGGIAPHEFRGRLAASGIIASCISCVSLAVVVLPAIVAAVGFFSSHYANLQGRSLALSLVATR